MESEFSTDSHPDKDFEMNILASTIAHEIRNPLQAMRLQLEAAKRTGNAALAFDSISSNLDRLEGVVTRIQSLSHRYQLKPQQMNFQDVLESVLSSVRFWLEASGIHVHENICWEGDPCIEGDRELIEQVLLNLITNAIDSMPKGGDLKIRVSECEHSAQVEIVDSGSGMARDVQSRIGTPFYTTKEKGNGLGVAFCKSIIALHGGQIEYDSVVGEGTRVSISLPKVQEAK